MHPLYVALFKGHHTNTHADAQAEKTTGGVRHEDYEHTALVPYEWLMLVSFFSLLQQLDRNAAACNSVVRKCASIDFSDMHVQADKTMTLVSLLLSAR